MDIIMRAQDIPADLLEFFEPVEPNAAPDWQFWPTTGGVGSLSVPTTERVSVPADEAGSDTVRIPSEDCPVHGHRQPATAAHDASGVAREPRTVDTGAHPDQARPLLPLDTPRPDTTAVPGSSGADHVGAHAATLRSTSSNRTAPVPSSVHPDSPSAEMTFRTGDTSGSLAGAAPHLDTHESNTSAADSLDDRVPQSPFRTAGNGPLEPSGDGCGVRQSPNTAESSISVASVSNGSDPSEQTTTRTADTSTSACSCVYYKEIKRDTSHFAAFPLGLPSLAIRAGTSERGVCGTCGAPWARVVERTFTQTGAGLQAGTKGFPAENGWGETPRGTTESETTGWWPTCTCNAGTPTAAVVLDPFVGSGTTLIAADRLGRSAIGIDVQPTYIDLAAGRAQRDAPLFVTVEVERQAEAASKQRDLFSVLNEPQEGVTNAAG